MSANECKCIQPAQDGTHGINAKLKHVQAMPLFDVIQADPHMSKSWLTQRVLMASKYMDKRGSSKLDEYKRRSTLAGTEHQ